MTSPSPRTTAARHYILAHYFYYSGTRNTPKDGPLTQNGFRLEFASRREAESFLLRTRWEGGLGCEKCSGNTYTPAGLYVTAHGEYCRPVYRIRKVPARPRLGLYRNR